LIKAGLVVIMILSLGAQADSTEPQVYQGIRNRVELSITDTEFAGERILEWVPMRDVDSPDYLQKTVTYWCYWKGAEFPNGDIEAHAEIYNRPDDLKNYVVEIARFGWYELTVKLDKEVVCVFPRVAQDGIMQLGYITIGVTID
jgi:hypothetical protein